MKERVKDFFKDIINKKFIISILLLLLVQSILFFVTKLFETNYHTFDSTIDSKIPFIPQFITIYNLFYPVVIVAFIEAFRKDRKTYYNGIIAGIIGYLIADIIFITYPTIIVRPEIPTNLDFLTNLIINITYSLDFPINCFPSIHCIFCFQALYTVFKSKDITKTFKWITNSLLFLIAISTVLVKQHYFYDILGSLMIFILTNFVTIKFKLYPKIRKLIIPKKN